MTLTKDRIIASVYNHLDLPKTRSAEMVESVLEIIKESLENGEDVLISGFGRFCVKDKNERRGRNLTTGGYLTLEARRIVTFKCSSVLKDKVNRK